MGRSWEGYIYQFLYENAREPGGTLQVVVAMYLQLNKRQQSIVGS